MQPLTSKRVLVTAGGTREAIDAVRFIANRSSGKQGYAIAEVAHELGAEVVLVTTVVRDIPAGVERHLVETAAEMREAMLRLAASADIVIMAAAVADFRPVAPLAHKHKKSEGVLQIVLEPTEDILLELGASKPEGQILVGFAAESHDVESSARKKLEDKCVDIIVANDITDPNAGFETDHNEVLMLSWADAAGGEIAVEHVPNSTKLEVAKALLQRCGTMLQETSPKTG